MTHILHRQTGHSYPVAASGHGVTIRDADGKEYILTAWWVAVEPGIAILVIVQSIHQLPVAGRISAIPTALNPLIDMAMWPSLVGII